MQKTFRIIPTDGINQGPLARRLADNEARSTSLESETNMKTISVKIKLQLVGRFYYDNLNDKDRATKIPK